MNGILYVVATPIGNLSDITLRALETLKKVDIIACEDTRVTKKLLQHYNIQKSLVSYYHHSQQAKSDFLIKNLKAGKNIALVTDAGTPGLADPGNKLIAEIVKNNIKVIPIPGASALATIISVAGINLQKFVFFGFPPHKKGRKKFFQEIISSRYPVVYYESSHRIIKNLRLLQELKCEKNFLIGRELTKFFEEIWRGNIQETFVYFASQKEKIKGEFVIIVH